MVLLKNQVPITIVLVFIVCLQCFGNCDEDKKELLPETGLELKHETLQNYQGDQPTSGESFVAVPVSGVGTKEELNPKLVGLINISKLYLPQEYEFKEIISATREIVAGVRYTIQVKARDDNKLETECQLVILEKPWLHNNWGDKIRELEKSNCTSSSGALNIDGLQTGVTDGEYKFGTMFNPNPLFINSGGLTPEKVTHVDAQVMTFNYKTDNTPEVVTRVPDSAFSDCTDNVPVVVTPPPYVVDVSQITYYNSDTPLTSDNDQNVIAKRHETEIANKEEDIVAEGSETVTEKNTAQVPTSVAPERINIPINVPQKPKHIIQSVDASLNFLDEKEPEPTVNEIPDTSNNKVPSSQTLFFSVSDPEDEEVEEYDDMDFINQADVRHITKEEVEQAILQFYSESEKKRNNENIKRSLGSSPLTSVNELDIDDSLKEYLRDALTSPEERSSATIKRESKENFNEPDNEKIDSIPKHVFLFTDDNPSDDQDNEELPLISEASIRTEIISEPVFDKQIVNIEIPADSLGDVPTLGGIESTGHTEVAPYTDDLISHFSLNVLPIGGLSSIQVGSITNVTKQVVAGISYKGTILYLVKPTDYTQKMYTVTCDFNIWIRSWLEPPMDKIISETCDTSNLNQLRQRRGVAGGVTSIKPSELSGFTNLLLDAALKGDVAKSKVEIVSITNTTKQVVAGMLYTGIVTYRVLDDDQSQTLSCNFKIWDRPWLKIGEKVSLTCDGKELVAFEDNNTRRKRSLLYDRRNPNYVNEEELRLQSMFNKFVVDYGKSYANVLERAARYRIFKSNLVLIDQLNRNELGTAEYGITEFADLTTAEYKLRTGLVPRPNGESNDISKLSAEIPDNVDLPKSFDWREKNAVTPVKNQGSCGSCWAFSVTGNIEGLNAIKTGKLNEFSEQELLDCDTVDSACNGGLPDNAYQAIEKIGGLEYESEYPYKAKKDTCKFSSDKARVKLSSSVDLPKNETAMALWLIQNGPISIGINANAMQFYRGGVSHPWKVLCLPSKIDHGVLIVGYGVVENVVFNKTMPYWIVKNSWGTTWGEQGYYRIFRGTNACGVSEMASSAILA